MHQPQLLSAPPVVEQHYNMKLRHHLGPHCLSTAAQMFCWLHMTTRFDVGHTANPCARSSAAQCGGTPCLLPGRCPACCHPPCLEGMAGPGVQDIQELCQTRTLGLAALPAVGMHSGLSPSAPGNKREKEVEI